MIPLTLLYLIIGAGVGLVAFGAWGMTIYLRDLREAEEME